MEIKCIKCNKLFKVKPSRAESRRYCSRECSSKKVTKPCAECGKEVARPQSQMLKTVYCGRACSSAGTGRRMSKMNALLNPSRMSISTRKKLREAHLGKGEGKAYRKYFGKHLHRVLAAEKIGRALRKGEVVHHIDGNILNNNLDNLAVLTSQSEHINLHRKELIEGKKNKC